MMKSCAIKEFEAPVSNTILARCKLTKKVPFITAVDALRSQGRAHYMSLIGN